MNKDIPREPIRELLVTELLPEQIKVLEQYRICVEPVWINETLYSNLILPVGSLHGEDPTQGPGIWSVILPGGMKVPYHHEGKCYAVLCGNE